MWCQALAIEATASRIGPLPLTFWHSAHANHPRIPLGAGLRTTSARDHDVSGMAPPSCMMRAHRSQMAANISNMAAPICRKICRPWRTILPAI
jgi:hypothetical protein